MLQSQNQKNPQHNLHQFSTRRYFRYVCSVRSYFQRPCTFTDHVVFIKIWFKGLVTTLEDLARSIRPNRYGAISYHFPGNHKLNEMVAEQTENTVDYDPVEILIPRGQGKEQGCPDQPISMDRKFRNTLTHLRIDSIEATLIRTISVKFWLLKWLTIMQHWKRWSLVRLWTRKKNSAMNSMTL